ncbi:MAG: imidazoleglycerol-phosphate dehydratase [Candidatus Omnitrophica bacterium]|nr:imidazoleglycerol-phosphate dehydratase [Candidatus Omnitrophota bacterium]
MGIFGTGKSREVSLERKLLSYERRSKETQIEIPLLNIDGRGESRISTTIGFLDHMLTLFAYHGYFDIEMDAKGDTHVDKHHLNEDIGLALGEAFKKTLGDSKGIVRTASAEVPMDKARARVLVDMSNRPAFCFEEGKGVGKEAVKDDEGYSLHYGKDFLESFANKMCMNLHVEISGEGDLHHYLEAVFKALGIALDKATRIDPRRAGEVPSSKGIL